MILPMQDEETGADPRIIHASISDPYLLLIRDDGSIFLAQMNSDDELEEVEKPEGVLTSSTRWMSGCLYTDSTGVFGVGKAENADKKLFMFLLSHNGGLHVSIPTTRPWVTDSQSSRSSLFQTWPGRSSQQRDCRIFHPS